MLRRNFLKNTAVAGAASVLLPEIVNASISKPKSKISLKENGIILFQGDSITDAGRKRDSDEMNSTSNLGNGYAFLAAADLLLDHADKDLKIYNKGISGNKVYQLAERWESDCLAIKPDVLSILIGVNDYWHKHNGKYDGTPEVYRRDYVQLLERTRKALPEVKLVIGEPFAVNKVKAVDDTWYPEFNEYRTIAKEIAEQFNAVFIPYQRVFDEAEKKAPGSYWTRDGVHPSVAGAQLMAQAWQKAVLG